MRFLLAGALVLIFVRPGPACAPPANTREIDAVIQRALAIWNVPGVAVAIVRADEVVYLKGHGASAVGTKSAVTPDTLFPIGSCTKAFVTAALAMLVAEGKLDWDDPVRKHVPFFRLGDPLADREVRIRDLLCHRTGLAGHHLLWYHAPWSQEESVRRAGRLPLDRPFRTTFQYQSTMFTAAGFAVKSAAGMPWDEFVQKRLLGPLGMKSTVFTSTAALKSGDVAVGHQLDRFLRPARMERYALPVPEAAGSIHTSARDMAKWMQFQMGEGAIGKKRLVPAAALGETHKPHIVVRLREADKGLFPDTVQLSYGLAWLIHDYRGHRLLSHGGAIDGFRTHISMVPGEKVGVVLMCNLHQTHMNLALCNSLLDVLLDLPRKDWNAIHRGAYARIARDEAARARAHIAARQRGTRPSRELAAYAGTYEHPAYGTVRVMLERGGLVWRWNDVRGALEHWHYDTFTLAAEPVGPAQVVFALDEAGTVAKMKVGGGLNVEFRRAVGKGKK
jgi:CubicO group peptidase (beta-lactamase class C family)